MPTVSSIFRICLPPIAGSEIDYVQFPFQTLTQKAGDCDDLLVLLASTLSVIGVECGFVDTLRNRDMLC